MPEKQSLIFIPDISGYTEFVKKTEISHSKHIITELLETIIDANDIGLKVSEIEGDAILFYSLNKVPSVAKIQQQIEKMYVAFHQHIKLYESHKICPCGACMGAIDLQLKFVVHQGALEEMKVKNFEKVYGESLILAHRLLKNDIPHDEYALFTESFQLDEQKYQVAKVAANYEGFEGVEHQYYTLGHLREKVKPVETPTFDPVKSPRVMKFTIDQQIDEVYEIVSNLDYRELWNDGVDKIEYEKGKLNRVGTQHRCVIGKNEFTFETISDTSSQFDGKRVYGERFKLPFMKEISVLYLLEAKGQQTQLEIQMHIHPLNPIGWILRGLIGMKLSKSLKHSISLLKQLSEKGLESIRLSA